MAGRRWQGGRLVIASHNLGKVREIGELLAPYGVPVVSAGALDLPEPEETGATFVENARLKALSAAEGSGLPALADDSGLEVAALDGQPGIYSARWAGPDRDFSLAMRKVAEALDGLPQPADRGARFVCALCLAWPDGGDCTFEGTVEGEIVWPPRGDRGFGFDPVFKPRGYDITFGEMAPAAKHAMSHRAAAFRKLVEQVFAET